MGAASLGGIPIVSKRREKAVYPCQPGASAPGKPHCKSFSGTSLVVQWLRIHFPMQGTWVQSLPWEDLIYHRATKLMCCNYRSPSNHSPCSTIREAIVVRKPHTATREQSLLATARESLCAAMICTQALMCIYGQHGHK